ncbi:MAG: hypothetical protein J7K75_07185 [Desulfuromonas sp.]|nr:hypothetical protein [Desulfuromonas sp.]
MPARCLSSITLWLLLVLIASTTSAGTLQGHLKSFSQIQQHRVNGANGQTASQWLSLAQLRLHATTQLSDALIANVATTYTALYRQHPYTITSPSANQHLDLTSTIGCDRHLLRQLEVDRLNLHWQSDSHEFIIGRQAIGFGRIGLYSPLDIIAPFAPAALITDVRPGIDAVRWNYFFSPTGQLQTLAVFGESATNRSFLASLETLLDDVDLLIISGTLGQRPMLGLGIAGQAFGVGLKAEAVCYHHRPATTDNNDPGNRFTIAALEADCRLPSGIYVAIEYLFNGCGEKNPLRYQQTLSSPFYREQRAYLPARNYLLTSLSYEAHPLLTVALFSIYNGDDHSLLFRPELAFSVSDNLNLELSYSHFSGHRSKNSVPASEYGDQGDALSLHASYYF